MRVAVSPFGQSLMRHVWQAFCTMKNDVFARFTNTKEYKKFQAQSEINDVKVDVIKNFM